MKLLQAAIVNVMSERYGDGITFTSTTWAERVFKLPALNEKNRGIFEGYKSRFAMAGQRISMASQRIRSGSRETRMTVNDTDMIAFVEGLEKKRDKAD